jgi:hypothetical protein
MKRDSIVSNYEYFLPNCLSDITVEQISYAEIFNDKKEIVYVSIWNGTEKDKETLLLNYFNRTYRTLQNIAKKYISTNEWNKKAKSDGYLKKLTELNNYGNLPLFVQRRDKVFWKNFKAIKESLIVRSALVSTAHRAQGITVDVAGIDIDDLDKSEANKLIYVALTRASKDLVYFRGKSE